MALVCPGWLFQLGDGPRLRDLEGNFSFEEITHLFDLWEVDFFVLLN